MQHALVVLAAGLGRRYGGLKQLEAVGPGGATIMDYSIFDARRAGFSKVVFVIRPEMERDFHAAIGQRYASAMKVAYAHQELAALPPGWRPPPNRTKPWGTAQAVLVTEPLVDGPFAVVNADDYYGVRSFAALGAFLDAPADPGPPTYAMVGFRLRDTLTEAGAVSRGVCRSTSEGWLEQITELRGLEKSGTGGARYVDDAGQPQTLNGDAVVSMNLWGFTPTLFDWLRTGFGQFLQQNGTSTEAEYYLPTALQEAMRAGRARICVLPTPEIWCGITHPADKARVSAMIARLIDRGVYPQSLWT